MCGIVGFTGEKNITLIKKMLSAVKHRGYDDEAQYYSNGINLGMNRLAINDLRQGLYPMIYKNYILVYNGEIYNYLLLKKKLVKKGVKLNTNCDAEVILPLYDFYGFKAFRMLEGMFAITIFDSKSRKVILARDKSGEKPLYYQNCKKRLIFASELKAILSYKLKSQKLNLPALGEYLHHGSIYGEDTLIKGVKKVQPSAYLIFDLDTGSVVIDRYWSMTIDMGGFVYKNRNINELKEKLSYLIRESVDKRLLADVPIGCFLSGGIDSSLITYFTAKKVRDLKTYSISFPDFSLYDESKYSQIVSSYLQTDHTEIPCTTKTVGSILENIGKYIDEPIVDPAVLPTFLMAQEARKSVKVVLTGEGADELFGGYFRFRKELLAFRIRSLLGNLSFLKKVSGVFFPGRFKKLFTQLSEHYTPLNIWTTDELKQLLGKDHQFTTLVPESNEILNKNILIAMQITDIRTSLSEQLLMKVDKMTMLNNLEARAPYLDANIINFALNLPNEYKIRGVYDKYLLRKVAELYLPKNIAWRTKKGFSLPLGEWFRADFKNIVFESFDDLRKYKQVINLGYYEQIIKKHMESSGTNGHSDKIWSMIVLSKWLKHFKISA